MSKLKVSSYSLNTLAQALASVKTEILDASGELPCFIAWEFMSENERHLQVELMLALDDIGVWDSTTHGNIVWWRIRNSLPIYIPLLAISEGIRAREISQSAYRVVFLDLNNAKLQEEGFE